MRSRVHIALVLAALMFLLWTPVAQSQDARGVEVSPELRATEELEEFIEEFVSHSAAGGYYTWVDEDGQVITYTAIAPVPGDSYITADNRLYEVAEVTADRTVRARFVEQLQLRASLPAVSRRWPFGAAAAQARTGGDTGAIGIYHSHNAESYVDTSQREFEVPFGDILQVGRALKQALEEQGFRVIHSENSHLPHDGGAYQRSRATVRELLEQGAVALIDVHRDAIPAEAYRTEVAGQEMTKVRLVVGRQNPNSEANFELAKNIKALADERYPGLIKGIFNARGNYNQDVGPRAILLEFGTHETSLEEAVRATRYIADVFPQAAGLTAGGAGAALGRAGWRSALWLALAAGVGAFGYLWINEGSFQRAWRRLTGFFRKGRG